MEGGYGTGGGDALCCGILYERTKRHGVGLCDVEVEVSERVYVCVVGWTSLGLACLGTALL